jgi:pimeloyl-ACP methyl ester carboxylesterase
MRTVRWFVLLSLVAALVAPAHPAQAQIPPLALPGLCLDGTLRAPSKALTKLCVPAAGWNGDVLIYAHGYVAPGEPLEAYESQLTLPDGTYLPYLTQALGYAFATTSYRRNGLVILDALDDIELLVADVRERLPGVGRVFLAGVSEGGLVTALGAERLPSLFQGAYATCGPIGNFRAQIDYFGDFRVLFDYFFPGVLPASPVEIPTDVMEYWEAWYAPNVAAALASRPDLTLKLLNTARAPFDPADPETAIETAIGLLWYNVFATNNAARVLHGNPFDNSTRWYYGSGEDLRLNMRVQRFRASPAALAAMKRYNTSGHLTIPLVTLHTTGDPIVPFTHELLYAAKARPTGRGAFLPLPVSRYGHCQFTTTEVLTGLGLLVALP